MFGAATARCTSAAPMNRQFCPPYVPDTPCQPFSLPTQTADSVLRSFAERTHYSEAFAFSSILYRHLRSPPLRADDSAS